MEAVETEWISKKKKRRENVTELVFVARTVNRKTRDFISLAKRRKIY